MHDKANPIDEKIERMLNHAARDFRTMAMFEPPQRHHHPHGCGCHGCRGHCPMCPTGATGATGGTGATGTCEQQHATISESDYLALPDDRKRTLDIQWIVYPD